MQRRLIGRTAAWLQRANARPHGPLTRYTSAPAAAAVRVQQQQQQQTPTMWRLAAAPSVLSFRGAASWAAPRRAVPHSPMTRHSAILPSAAQAAVSGAAVVAPLIAVPAEHHHSALSAPRARRSHLHSVGPVAPFSSVSAAGGPASAPRPVTADATVAASSEGAAVAAAHPSPSPASAATAAGPVLDAAAAAAAPPPSLLFRLTPTSFHPYLLLARADKPVGTWLLLLPCLWSLGLAAAPGTLIDLKLAAVMAVGAFVMRGAGCTINDLWDRDFDRRVARTRDRPLASGLVSVPQAMTLLAAQLGVGLAVVMQLNWVAIGVAFCSIPLVVIYPLMKRYTYWPQSVLGLTFNWGVWVGWAAVHATVPLETLAPLYLAGVCWTLVYDTIYAHQDVADDVLIGVKSTALHFGDRSTQWLTGFASSTVALLGAAGWVAGLGPVYATVAVGGGAMHLAWQLSTVRFTERASCNAKFVSNVQFGWIVLLGIVLDRLFAQPQPEPSAQAEEEAAKGEEKDAPKQQLQGVAAAITAPATLA